MFLSSRPFQPHAMSIPCMRSPHLISSDPVSGSPPVATKGASQGSRTAVGVFAALVMFVNGFVLAHGNGVSIIDFVPKVSHAKRTLHPSRLA